MSAPSDSELVEQFKNGNEAAFNELVIRYQEKMYWVARRFLNDHDGADDVVQDVFVKAYESLKHFRGESSLYTWLYRIAVNLSLNVLRRRRIREFFRLDDVLHLGGEAEEEPDRIMEAHEQRRLIEEAVDTLPEKQRTTFILRHYDEMPYEEISKILKTSVGGLKANYFHAVRKIGRYLKHAHATRRTSSD